jgi:hypothetical protein
VQVFEGICIKRQGSGARETFTVRKNSFGVGVERTFPLHSPKIEKLEVAMIGDVNRAKLYYLRGRVGKKARIRELRQPSRPHGAAAAARRPARFVRALARRFGVVSWCSPAGAAARRTTRSASRGGDRVAPRGRRRTTSTTCMHGNPRPWFVERSDRVVICARRGRRGLRLVPRRADPTAARACLDGRARRRLRAPA